MYTLPVSANAINAPVASAPLPIIGMDHSSNITDKKRSVRGNNGENLQKGYLLNEHSWYLTIQPNKSVMAVRGPNPIYGLLMIHLIATNLSVITSPDSPFAPSTIRGPGQPQKRSSKHPPHIIKGVKSGLYLCIDKRAKVYSSPTLTEECHIYLENDTTNEIDQFYRKGLPSDKINIKKCPRKFKKQYRKNRPYRLYIGIHNRGRIMRACRAGPYGSKRRDTSSPKSSRFQIVWEVPPPPGSFATPPPGPFATPPPDPITILGPGPPTNFPRATKPEAEMDADKTTPLDPVIHKVRRPIRRRKTPGRKRPTRVWKCKAGINGMDPFHRLKCRKGRLDLKRRRTVHL